MCRAAARSPIASASSAATRLHQSASTATPRLHPLQLLLPDCVRFSCCSPIASASAGAPRLHRSASTAAPHLRPLQLLLPDCVHFSCCSPIASASAATFFRVTKSSVRAWERGYGPNILEHSSWSSRLNKWKYEGRTSLV